MQNEAVNQWLDTDQVRSLAEGLLEQNLQVAPISNEKMFGASFVGFADPSNAVPPISTVAQKSLSEAQSRAASSGIIKEGAQVTPAKAVTSAKIVEATAEVSEPSKVGSLTEPLDSKVEVSPKTNEPAKGVEPKKIAEAVTPRESKSSEASGEDSQSVEAPVKSDEISKSSELKKSSTQASPASSKESPKEENVVKKTVLDKSGGSTKIPAQSALGSRPAPVKKPDLMASPFKVATKPKRVTKPAPPARDAFRPVPLSTRLQAFGGWLKEQIPTRAYFICDRHGEIVVDEVGSEKLVKVARTLAHASSSAGRQVGDDKNLGSLHVKVGPDRVMEVIPRHSHFGLVVLGVIVPRPLSRDAVASVSRALGTALAEPSALR